MRPQSSIETELVERRNRVKATATTQKPYESEDSVRWRANAMTGCAQRTIRGPTDGQTRCSRDTGGIGGGDKTTLVIVLRITYLQIESFEIFFQIKSPKKYYRK